MEWGNERAFCFYFCLCHCDWGCENFILVHLIFLLTCINIRKKAPPPSSMHWTLNTYPLCNTGWELGKLISCFRLHHGASCAYSFLIKEQTLFWQKRFWSWNEGILWKEINSKRDKWNRSVFGGKGCGQELSEKHLKFSECLDLMWKGKQGCSLTLHLWEMLTLEKAPPSAHLSWTGKITNRHPQR